MDQTAALAAARTELVGEGKVTEGFCGVDVAARGDNILLVFRWRKDPNLFALRLPPPDDSPLNGMPVDSPEKWALELFWLLMEELCTGLVRCGRRTLRDGFVELDLERVHRPWPEDLCWGEVPVVRAYEPGLHLSRAGLDVSKPLVALRDNRVVSWLQAYLSSTAHPFLVVGQALVTWDVQREWTAVLEVLETVSRASAAVAESLVFETFHDAAEAGALQVVTRIEHPALTEVGFRRTDSGELVAPTREVV